MLIHVKLGVPLDPGTNAAMTLDELEVAKVFPYGKLLPLEITVGGLSFHTGRVVEELGDEDDVGVCVVASVSLGYGNEAKGHTTYNTKDGY